MRAIRPIRLAAALVIAAAACSDSPTQPHAADLASALGQMSLSSVVPASMSAGVPGAMYDIVPSSCSYVATSQSFVCATRSAVGLTVNSSYALLATSGAPQSAFDPAATAAIRTMVHVAGTQPIAGGTLALDDQQTLTLSGLLTGRHVLDGTQISHLTATVSGKDQQFTYGTLIAGVELPERGSTNPYPRAGTITINFADGVGSTTAGSTMTIVMTFNGTSKVTLTMTVSGFTDHCTFDLAHPDSRSALVCS